MLQFSFFGFCLTFLTAMYCFFPNFLQPLTSKTVNANQPAMIIWKDSFTESILYSVFCMAPCYVVTFIKKNGASGHLLFPVGKYSLPLFYALYLELFPLKFHLQINYVMLNLNFSPHKYSSHPNLCQMCLQICLPCLKFRALLDVQMIPRPGWEHSSFLEAITHVDAGSI